MTRCCSAYGCSNASYKQTCKEKGITYHAFPHKNPLLMKVWLRNIQRADFVPSQSSSLCSAHFTEDSFRYQPFTNMRLLKPDAVPTLFAHERSVLKQMEVNVFQLPASTNFADEECDEVKTCSESIRMEEDTDKIVYKEESTQTEENLFMMMLDENLALRKEIESLKSEMSKRSFVFENIKNDKVMMACTGYTIAQFKKIYDFLNLTEKEITRRNTSPIDQLFYFFVLLRTGMSEELLGAVCNTSQSNVSTKFIHLTNVIYGKIRTINENVEKHEKYLENLVLKRFKLFRQYQISQISIPNYDKILSILVFFSDFSNLM